MKKEYEEHLDNLAESNTASLSEVIASKAFGRLHNSVLKNITEIKSNEKTDTERTENVTVCDKCKAQYAGELWISA